VIIDSQDGGDLGLFTKIGSGSWQEQQPDAGPCSLIVFYPKAVLEAWAMSTIPPAGTDC
jgi:hypothetical protein